MQYRKLGRRGLRVSAVRAQLSLAWCLRENGVSSVIVGATKTAHVDDNVAAADLEVDPQIFKEMDQILEPVTHR